MNRTGSSDDAGNAPLEIVDNDADALSARYRRHEMIDWLDQRALLQTTVAVIGAGAIGNEVIKNLALLGVGHIDVFDFDHIEEHNLTRAPLFRPHDVGKAKAEVAAERACELDPNIQVTPVCGDFWDHMPLNTLRSRYAVVMSCVDNFEARMRASLMCRLAGVNFVSAGIDSRYASVQSHPFANGVEPACFECDLGAGVYESIARRYSCGWLQRSAWVERKVPTTAITAASAGALAVSRCLRLAGHGADEMLNTSERILLDTISGRTSVVALDHNEDCIACGDIAKHVSVQRATAADLLARHADGDAVLSEAVITACACQNDPAHTADRERAVMLTPAAGHSDALMHCEQCNDLSVQVDMSDILSLDELRNYATPLRCKFVRVSVEADAARGDHQIVYELERQSANPQDTNQSEVKSP